MDERVAVPVDGPFQPAPAAKSRCGPALPKARPLAVRAKNLQRQKGAHLAADLVFRIAIVGLFLFSAVLASMLWLNV
ncbi:hypothetical protein [Bradyrhizobium sp. LA2.1]|uniref:hypothetical protein n=1 Tax=Bradyrhizobium sp. LA2.1 TaxID=3156376 RepID=UPI0033920CCB